MLFTAIYTERPGLPRDASGVLRGPEIVADILVIFARRDELSESDIAGTRANLEAEGQIVYAKDAESLTEFTETIEPRGEALRGLRKTNGMNIAQLEALGAPNSGSPEPRGDAVALRGHTKREAVAAMKLLRGFIGASQMACLADACRGEEKQFFFDKLCEYADRIAAMPQTYGQDGPGDEATVHLHYFNGGCDWYITEKDKGTAEENSQLSTLNSQPPQHQAFGYANLGDPMNAELGYISIVEIIANGAELDLYWPPKPLKDCKNRVAT